jgi:hypothetical protein
MLILYVGITRETIAFTAALLRSGVVFERTLTIGRQELHADGQRVQAGFREAGIDISRSVAESIAHEGNGYSEPLLRHLGAHDVDSVDASQFEGCTIVHDLNKPLPAEYHGSYSVVLDAGTLEHVFDFPVALKTCLEAVSVGGHYLAVSPVNNLPGHGFYQFTPELYFRALSEENGFRVRCMLWRSWHAFARWYRVADPASVGHRVERTGVTRALLYVAAQRVERRSIFASPLQQSDYATRWSAGSITTAVQPSVTRLLARHLPLTIKDSLHLLHDLGSARRVRSPDFDCVTLADIQPIP